MATFDIRKGYYHVCLHPSVRRFFGISFVLNGVTYYARYIVAPFGFSPMQWLFTKLLKPWITKWRGEGKKILIFIDDGLIVGDDFDTENRDAQEIRRDLRIAGLMEQPTKCNWTPQQIAEWLGLIINLSTITLEVPPPQRKERVLSSIDRALVPPTSPRKLLAAAGNLIFACIQKWKVTIWPEFRNGKSQYGQNLEIESHNMARI